MTINAIRTASLFNSKSPPRESAARRGRLGAAAPRTGERREGSAGSAEEGRMSGDDPAELLRALVERQRAEDASARAAHTLAEAEERAEDDQEAAAEVVQARERYEAAVAAADAARSRRREIEAGSHLATWTVPTSC